jgi:hypothetical protein
MKVSMGLAGMEAEYRQLPVPHGVQHLTFQQSQVQKQEVEL